jgi:hypothetical protein
MHINIFYDGFMTIGVIFNPFEINRPLNKANKARDHRPSPARLIKTSLHSKTGTPQKLTFPSIALIASAGTTLRATKSSQFLNLVFRASIIALTRAGPTSGSLSSSSAGAVFRLTFLWVDLSDVIFFQEPRSPCRVTCSGAPST